MDDGWCDVLMMFGYVVDLKSHSTGNKMNNAGRFDRVGETNSFR